MRKSNFSDTIGVFIGALLGLIMGAVIGYLLFLQPAHAAPGNTDANGYCNAIARLSESVAVARDNGVPREVVLGTIVASVTDPQAIADARATVLLAFGQPRFEPEEEAALAFQVCWETYGE